MVRKSMVCLAVLLSLGCWLAFAAKPDAAKPGKLMRVTLESDAEIGVMPLNCVGADVVNLTGHGKHPQEGAKRITFDCLPGAVVWLISKDAKPDAPVVVTLLREDDGKTVKLNFQDGVSYKNGVPCTIAFAKEQDFIKQLDRLKEAVQGKNGNSLMVLFKCDGDALLSILRELKGTGVGLMFDSDGSGKNGKKVSELESKKLIAAIGEVKPRRMMMDVGQIAALDAGLADIETLYLSNTRPVSKPLPDLSKLRALRHLMLMLDTNVDLKPLEKLTHLKSLTLAMNKPEKSLAAISSLRELEFLVLHAPAGDVSVLKPLSHLRYLAAEFPVDTDFSFVEKMPDLQTLCIMNLQEKHNLEPLQKASRLKCLALSKKREPGEKNDFESKIKTCKNVKEFEKARPDVEVVEYRGLCLGSAWILLAAAAAAIAAWLIRRRRAGNRMACQR